MTETNAHPETPLLLVDDEIDWLESLSFSLEMEGIAPLVTCQDSRQVMGLLEHNRFSLIVLDLNMPHIGGDELLRKITVSYPDTPVIILSGMNQLESAMECMRCGAFDYFVKTEERERLLNGIRRALSHRNLADENLRLKDVLLHDGPAKPELFAPIITRNKQLLRLFSYLEAIAGSAEPLLICGESGVGKELFAQAVHRLHGEKAPWVAVNVSGLDDNMFSDTLFGHVKGAFSGAERDRGGLIETAQDGILFLDEIGDLTTASQVKLLRLLQEHEYFPLGADRPRKSSVRIITATNQDLEAKVTDGSFRRDLFYRLNTHKISIPSLAERREDLPLLIEHFTLTAATDMQKPVPQIPADLPRKLAGHPFPGNIRELRGMIYDAVSSGQDGALALAPFQRAFTTGADQPISRDTTYSEMLKTLPELPTLESSSQQLVIEALRRTSGNQSAAARLLGISQPAVNKRIKSHK